MVIESLIEATKALLTPVAHVGKSATQHSCPYSSLSHPHGFKILFYSYCPDPDTEMTYLRT